MQLYQGRLLQDLFLENFSEVIYKEKNHERFKWVKDIQAFN